jgi:hypothetical protein
VTTFTMPTKSAQTFKQHKMTFSGCPEIRISSPAQKMRQAPADTRSSIGIGRCGSQNVPTGTSVDQSVDIVFGAVKLTESCP